MIRLIGIKKLTEEEKQVINRILPEYYNRFLRDTTPKTFTLHIKKYEKEGKRAKYSLKARLDNPKLEASTFDWKLNTALHKVLKKIENEIRHKYKDHD